MNEHGNPNNYFISDQQVFEECYDETPVIDDESDNDETSVVDDESDDNETEQQEERPVNSPAPINALASVNSFHEKTKNNTSEEENPRRMKIMTGKSPRFHDKRRSPRLSEKRMQKTNEIGNRELSSIKTMTTKREMKKNNTSKIKRSKSH